jgi:hypothetical protein
MLAPGASRRRVKTAELREGPLAAVRMKSAGLKGYSSGSSVDLTGEIPTDVQCWAGVSAFSFRDGVSH